MVELKEKHYSILNPDVRQRIQKSLFEWAMISLHITPLPSDEAPVDLTPSEINVRITGTHRSNRGGLVASGRTSKNHRVNVHLPRNEDVPSTLTMYEAKVATILAEIEKIQMA